MRYSRMKRGRSQRKYVSMIIAMVVIFGGIYFFTAGAMGKHISKWVAPFLKADNGIEPIEQKKPLNSEGVQDNPDTQLTLPDKQDGEKDHVPRITETIKVEEMKFHAIQMGAFNDGENAKSIAEQLKTKGGAGYVLEDQYFRVMAMALLLESDALAVKEQLKTQEVEAQIYEINCPGVDMDITASSEKIEGIKSSFALLKESMEIVESIIKDLDKDKITLGSGMDKLGQIKSQMEAKIEQIDGYSVTQGGSQVLDGLKDVFVQETKNIDIIIKGNTSDKVAISSKIKYTYIDMIIRHKKYIEQISNG